MSNINLKDNLRHHDSLGSALNKPYARTKIIGGYDAYKDKNGVTRFGEVLFETENMIVLGGSLFTLEKVFGVKSGLKVDYLNDIMGIATEGPEIPEIYPKDNVVCLFGVGIGGAGESYSDKKIVHYHENEIFDMIPLRQTDIYPGEQYWFKKSIPTDDSVSKTAYYLKTFEDDPEIKVLWKDSEGDDDGSAVLQDHITVETDSNGNVIPKNNSMETFIEITLKISKNDVREYFKDTYGNIEQCRVNSIGLFTGIKSPIVDEPIPDNPADYDYKQVKLFSKLNINNEMLTLAKDLTISYRIYTS